MAAPAHLGALIAARPRILAMIQDVVTKHLPVTRLAAIFEAATATYLEALDDEDRATAKQHVQRAAQTVDEACSKRSRRTQQVYHEPDSVRDRSEQLSFTG